MFKLRATIIKDLKILTRDKVGLTLMFVMPIILAIIIASVQNSTFELVNENKIPVLLYSEDTGAPAKELENALANVGMFNITAIHEKQREEAIKSRIDTKNALVAIVIPATYSAEVEQKSQEVSKKALKNIYEEGDSASIQKPALKDSSLPLIVYYHPVLQQSFRKTIEGGLQSGLQIVQSKYIVKNLYFRINEEPIPDSLETTIVSNQTPVIQIPVTKDGTRQIPNATQHNIPAWTIFAMFFIVISLGSSIVREKVSGSFIRLRTLPTNFGIAMISKQIAYVLVTILQAAVIFFIGATLFPYLGLPALNIPDDWFALFLVTLLCGWCAASFAICVGVFANTQEQANGFGAVSIVLLAAIGGLLVPSFAMPESFQTIMRISPLHWCLEAYYGLFLEAGSLQDIIVNIMPLLLITVLLQFFAFYGLKRKKLI